MLKISFASRIALGIQRMVSHLFSPLWLAIWIFLLRYHFRYKIKDRDSLRARYRQIIRERDGPILICANHLTLIDSMLIGHSLGSAWSYMWKFSSVPWNLPEQTNFAATNWSKLWIYITKCLPIVRGGPRIAETLGRFAYLIARGEVGLVFPEGGRSRSGQIEVEKVANGTGRVFSSVPNCKVLCVYLRGDHQDTFSNLPKKGDSFYVELGWAEPSSKHRGLRRSVDISRQIAQRLREMEQAYFEQKQSTNDSPSKLPESTVLDSQDRQ